MAKITVTLNGVVHYKDLTSTAPITDKIVLSTDKQEANVFFAVGEKVKTTCKYRLSISDFSMQKKMYEPTEIIVDLAITPSQGDSSDYQEIGRKQLEELFKHIRVGLSEGSFSIGDDFYVHEVIPSYQSKSMHVTLKIYSLDKLMTVKQASRTFVSKKLGEDILKAEVPKYITPWTIEREIPSLEKQLEKAVLEKAKLESEVLFKFESVEMTDEEKKTIKKMRKKDPQGAQALEESLKKRKRELTEDEVNTKKVRLSLLTPEITKLNKDIEDKAKKQERMTYTTDNMRILFYDSEEVEVTEKQTVKNEKGEDVTQDVKVKKIVNYEHIFPYLVQYNESFHDMLARTTNRWGEFLYYENGTLNVGYDAKAKPIPIDRKLIQDISYPDLNAKYLTVAADGKYDYEADNSALTGRPLQKSPVITKGQIDFVDKQDKWVMKQIAAIFKNDKNLNSFLPGWLIDNLFSLAMAKSSTAKLNSDYDGKYFPDDNKPGRDEQYGTYNFANKKKNEDDKWKDGFQQFSEFDTAFNGKKYTTILGKEQTVGKDAICINFGTNHPELKLGNIISFNGENFIVVEIVGGFDAKGNLTFQVTGTAQDKKDQIFYPAVIPAGHVRYASPQVATITDPNDPTSLNRARVSFSWQEIKYLDDLDKSKGATDETIKQSTPWLNFASNQNGYPVMGYHYTGNQVMVGFEDGNVERPYILGGLADDFFFVDSALASPGMHQLTLNDGYGDGLTAFLSGALSPMLKTILAFCPKGFPKWDFKQSKYLEGGFELTDYYGIYKISGSTDGRNVSIASNWGDVKINAFTGISISAPNGDVKISGKNVTIEAGNNLSLVSGKNVGQKILTKKDTKKGTAAQLLLDATAAVAKKLAQVAFNIVDLSLVRSTVEIFFRPVEGALTVKSNRFLKLEAGKAKCAYPEIAYNKEKKLKVMNEANKKAIIEGANVGQGLIDVFKKIPVNSGKLIDQFIAEYKACVEILEKLNYDIQYLKQYSNGDQAYMEDQKKLPCKSYDDLKEDLWKQEKDEKWKEDKLEFTEEVKVDGDAIDCVNATCLMRFNPNSTQFNVEELPTECKRIVARRKQIRKSILEEFNTLRNHIYNLTHLEPDKIAVNKMFHPTFSENMPKDFKKKLITAFSKEKCPNVRIYKLMEADKSFMTKKPLISIDEREYMKRLVIMNLLDEFGFKDDTRKKLGVDLTAKPPKPGEVPVKPKADVKDANKADNIMNDECWQKYIQSLNALPKLEMDTTTIGGAILGAVKGEWDAAFDKMKFWKGLAERGTWGDGKKGQILFGSGDDTYYLGDQKIEKVTSTLRPTLTSLSADTADDKDKALLNYWMNKFREALIKL